MKTIKEITKRLQALVLVSVMIVTMLPQNVYAEEVNSENVLETIDENESVGIETEQADGVILEDIESDVDESDNFLSEIGDSLEESLPENMEDEISFEDETITAEAGFSYRLRFKCDPTIQYADSKIYAYTTTVNEAAHTYLQYSSDGENWHFLCYSNINYSAWYVDGSGAEYVNEDGTLKKDLPSDRKVLVAASNYNPMLEAGDYSFIINLFGEYLYCDFNVLGLDSVTGTIEQGVTFNVTKNMTVTREKTTYDRDCSYYTMELKEGSYQFINIPESNEEIRLYIVTANDRGYENELKDDRFMAGAFQVTHDMVTKYGVDSKVKMIMKVDLGTDWKNAKLTYTGGPLTAAKVEVYRDNKPDTFVMGLGSSPGEGLVFPRFAKATLSYEGGKKVELYKCDDFSKWHLYFDHTIIYNDTDTYEINRWLNPIYDHPVDGVPTVKPGKYNVKYKAYDSDIEAVLMDGDEPYEATILSEEQGKELATDFGDAKSVDVVRNEFVYGSGVNRDYVDGNPQLFKVHMQADENYVITLKTDSGSVYDNRVEVFDSNLSAQYTHMDYLGGVASVTYTPNITSDYYINVWSVSKGKLSIVPEEGIASIKIKTQPALTYNFGVRGQAISRKGMSVSVVRGNGKEESFSFTKNAETADYMEEETDFEAKYHANIELLDSTGYMPKFENLEFLKPGKYRFVIRDSSTDNIYDTSKEITVKEPVLFGELFSDVNSVKIAKSTSGGYVWLNTTLEKDKNYEFSDTVTVCKKDGSVLLHGGSRFSPDETGEYYIKCFRNPQKDIELSVSEVSKIKDFYLASSSQPEYKFMAPDYITGERAVYSNGWCPWKSDIVVEYENGIKETVSCFNPSSSDSRISKLGFEMKTVDAEGVQVSDYDIFHVDSKKDFYWEFTSKIDGVLSSKPVRVKYSVLPSYSLSVGDETVVNSINADRPNITTVFYDYTYVLMNIPESEKAGEKYRLTISKANSKDATPSVLGLLCECNNGDISFIDSDENPVNQMTIKNLGNTDFVIVPGKTYHMFLASNKDLCLNFSKLSEASSDYTITYDKNAPVVNGISRNVVGSMADTRAKKNADVKLNANKYVCKGYKFAGWNTEKDGSGVAFGDGSVVRNLSIDGSKATLYAIWDEINYGITYRSNGVDLGFEPKLTIKVSDAEYVVPAIPDNCIPFGYSFGGWYDSSEYKNKITELKADDYLKNIELFAKIIPDKYYIRFNNSSTESNPISGSMAEQIICYGIDDKINTVKYTSKSGLGFAGWALEDNSGVVKVKNGEGFVLRQTGDSVIKTGLFKDIDGRKVLDLYAVWSDEFKLDYDLMNSSAEMPSGIIFDRTSGNIRGMSYKYGKGAKLPTPVLLGHTFDGWYASYDEGKDQYDGRIKSIDNKTSGDIKLFAKWIPYKYSVKFDSNGGTGKFDAIKNISYGDSLAIPTIAISENSFTKYGYKFIGYTTKDYASKLKTFVTNKNNLTDIISDIHSNLDSEGKIVPIYPIGELSDIGSIAKKNGETVSLYAVYVTNNNTLTLNTEGGKWSDGVYSAGGLSTEPGTVTNFAFSYQYNAKSGVTLPGATNIGKAGYAFDGWYTDKTYTKKVTSTKGLTGNITLYALWTAKYSIQFNGNAPTGLPEGISLSGSMDVKRGVQLKDSVSLPGTKYKIPGYKFMGWNTDKDQADSGVVEYPDKGKVKGPACSVVENETTGDLELVTVLYGVWKNSFEINYVPGNYIMGTATENYKYGDEVVLPVPKMKGYKFAGWYKDEKLKTRVQKVTKTMAEDLTLYPKWTGETYNITFVSDAPFGSKLSGKMNIQKLTWGTGQAISKVGYKVVGYEFVGWSDTPRKAYGEDDTVDMTGIFENQAKISGVGTVYQKNITLYGVWKKTKYSVDYVGLLSGVDVETSKKSYTVDDTLILPIPERVGYTFQGWYTDKNLKKKATDIMPGTTGNKQFYAKWSRQ